jgi:hypothetical protein
MVFGIGSQNKTITQVAGFCGITRKRWDVQLCVCPREVWASRSALTKTAQEAVSDK